MNKRDEPAFPHEVITCYESDIEKGRHLKSGLSKREYFAGLALQGLCQKYYDFNGVAAKIAVQFADALLAELEKSPTESRGEG